ncbi:cupin domain-containing protein [Pseudomonas serbica]|uniref:cupin domain-containing protein n=1 Tax=Pseudomonas serbica TaxID=2965074 RepID=UPI0039E5634F
MKTNKIIMVMGVLVSLSSSFVIADTTGATPMISNFDSKKLDAAPSVVVENADFMTVVENKGSKVKSVRVFESTDKKLTADLAAYEKTTLKLKDWPIDEYMVIIEGQLEISDEKGNSKIYGPGEAFVMPKGFTGTWRQLTDIKKMTVNYER